MLNTSRAFLYQEILSVTIRALRSITRDQTATAVQALASQDTLWNIDQHEDYDGYASLVITHAASLASFIISGTINHIEVAELRADELHQLGAYKTIDEAVLRIQQAPGVNQYRRGTSS